MFREPGELYGPSISAQISASFLAEISVGHPKKYLFSLSKKTVFWIKVSKKDFI